jgi:small-conductance mechanosensitive channel
MATSELKNRSVFFIIVVGTIALLLFLLPLVEPYLEAYVAQTFARTGDQMMAEAAVYLNRTIIKLAKVVMAMVLVVTIVRFVDYLIFRIAFRASDRSEISALLRNVFSIIIYIVAFFVIFQSQFPGVQLAPLFTGSAILGIVVGLALQDTLGNLFAGIALQADQPFSTGDVVVLGTRGSGVIESVSWRGVRIRTFQNKLLVISNSVLGKETIEVAPRDNLNARLVFFSTVYDAEPSNTAETVRNAIRGAENVSDKMTPVVRIKGFGDSGLDWEVKYWLTDYARFNETDALIRELIWTAFKEEKIEFPFPTRVIHVQNGQDTAIG